MLFIDKKLGGDVLLIDRKLAKLEDDAKYIFFSKFIELVKKPSNLTKTGKKKPHYPISHFLACFVKPIGQPCFYFVEGLADLTDNLIMSRAELKGEKIPISFSKWFL